MANKAESRKKGPIQYMPVIGGRERSLLMNLSKQEIVEILIQKSGAYGWPVIEAKLGLQKMSDPFAKKEYKLSRRTANWMSRSMSYATGRRTQLLAIPRERLVRLVYWFSDMELNRRYRSGQKTLNLDAPIQLDEDRKIELDKSSLQKMLRKSRAKKGKFILKKSDEKPKVKKEPTFQQTVVAETIKKAEKRRKRKLTKKEVVKVKRQVSQVKTLAWIKSLRSHLRYMGQNADTSKVD